MKKNRPEILAIIPARGGSKGLPRKNLAPLAGKPLIAWTIEAALESKSVSRVIVSTEDEEIAETARHFGAELPFLRPPELAEDNTPSMAPLLHALCWLREHEGITPKYVMLLQPTSPLRGSSDIDAAAELAKRRSAAHVISVCPAPCHPFHIMKLGADGSMESFFDSSFDEMQRRYPRRQELPPAYIENGAIYLSRCAELLASKSFYSPPPLALPMSEESSLDIDSASELAEAEKLLAARKKAEAKP
ncbi:MAG: hypothetical protein A2X49_02045 [Lentisphaerae bacterium GWF2_52_8]|nr:MAG: hypothetical protein A2X49_02045 [Lentisphaerae bacterium GWF2_52_8]